MPQIFVIKRKDDRDMYRVHLLYAIEHTVVRWLARSFFDYLQPSFDYVEWINHKRGC